MKHIGNNEGKNSAEHFDLLSPTIQESLLSWINCRICSSRKYSVNKSYVLKHIFEYESGNYVTNGQFKGAMLKFGYTPEDTDVMNWSFKIRVNRKRFIPLTSSEIGDISSL